MKELAIEAVDPIKDEYQHRYDVVTQRLPEDYPFFPSVDDIENAVRQQTSFQLATAKSYDEYETIQETPVMFQGHLSPVTMRNSFKGSNEELEDVLMARLNSKFGIQITDTRLELPEDVKATLVVEATESAIQRTTQNTVNDAWWLNGNWKVNQDIAEGRLSEGYVFTFGDNEIQLFNLDASLQPEVVNNIRAVLEKIAIATEGRLFAVMDTILLQHHDRMPNSLGEALGATGVFRINTALFELEHRLKDIKTDQDIEGYTYYQKTIAHEIGHLFDVNDVVGHEIIARLKELSNDDNAKTQYRSAFGPLLGWIHRSETMRDAEGNEVRHEIKGVGLPPSKTLILQNGKPIEVDTVEYFGQGAIDEAAPMTSYGYTNESEDFAEAFARYVLAGEETVEPLRREGIRVTIGSLIEVEPVPLPIETVMTASKVDLLGMKPKIVVPANKPLSIFIQSRWSKAPEWMTIAIGGNAPSDEELASQGKYK